MISPATGLQIKRDLEYTAPHNRNQTNKRIFATESTENTEKTIKDCYPQIAQIITAQHSRNQNRDKEPNSKNPLSADFADFR